MTELDIYLQQLIEECHKNSPKRPQLKVRFRSSGQKPFFRVDYAAGKVTLEANGYEAAIPGVGLVAAGVRSGHLGDYLQEWQPRFALRPLWLPSIEHPEETCRQVLALGYNAVILDETSLTHLSVFKAYGVKVILNPDWTDLRNRSFLEEEVRAEFKTRLSALPEVDGVFWEATFGLEVNDGHPQARDLLPADLALNEVRLLEENLGEGRFLVFYVPYEKNSPVGWLVPFCDDVGPKTKVAFAAVAGHSTQDHLALNPFWEALRQRKSPCYTPLVPIVNVGAVKQGEALWPTLALDLIEQVLDHCHRHCFEGVIALAPRLPKPGSLLYGNLWVASHAAWGNVSPDLLAETWFQSFRPECDLANLVEARRIAVELGRLQGLSKNLVGLSSAENCRIWGDSLLARVKALEGQPNVSGSDYFVLFACDARRIVQNFFHACRISSNYPMNNQEGKEPFWTSPAQDGRGAPFIVHDTPQIGAPETATYNLFEKESFASY